MAEFWEFGTIVAVDWETLAKDSRATKPTEDTRRWMVLVPANTSASRQWSLLSLDSANPGPTISNWSSMYGFVRVDE